MGATNSSTRNPNPPENSTSLPTISPVPANSSSREISPLAGMASRQTTAEAAEGKDEEEEEEEGGCGFCLFMKGGPCKDAFIAWEDCVEEEGEKVDLVAKCTDVTRVLKECLQANPDYYGPILKAEKRAEEQLAKEMREEDEQKKNAADIVVNETATSSSQ